MEQKMALPTVSHTAATEMFLNSVRVKTRVFEYDSRR